jgi:ribosomal protein S18 acetylase RimI-like enzyme
MTIAIRHASPADNGLLAELGAETFREAFGAQNKAEDVTLYLAKAFSPALQSKELADGAGAFLIAEIEGEPVGYVRLRESTPPASVRSSGPVEIVRFYARARWIGRGVGSSLMEAALREARGRGRDVIWLGVWEMNARAIAFYRKWGFAEVGSQPFRLGNDVQTDLVMARAVEGPRGDKQ